MKRRIALLLLTALVALAFALGCSAAAPAAPAQPAAPAPAAPAPTAAPAPAVAPRAPQQPAAPLPAPTAAPASEPVVAGLIRATPTAAASAPRPVPTSPSGEQARFGGIIRWVPQGSVGTLDSTFSGAAISRGVMWHVWETLLGWDQNGILQPDMLEKWELANDGKQTTLTLREGLKWHDGSAVEVEDILGSIDRWRSVDSYGKFINPRWVGAEKIDEKTFRINLNEATGLLMAGLGRPGVSRPNMMPKELAVKPSSEQVTTYIGSGPYKFVSWDPGNRIVLDRFADYKARPEAGSYLVGAKKAYADRLEMIEIPDQETRVAAVITGEVDFLDVISADFLEQARKSDKVKVHVGRPGAQPVLWFNLNDPLTGNSDKGRLIRQAVQAAINAEEVMKGYGDASMWTLCPSMFLCGTFWGQGDFSKGRYNVNNTELAKQLLQQAGYNGEPLILLDPADFPTIHPIPVVAQEHLRKAGFNIEYKTIDWATQIRLTGEPTGWHIQPTWFSSILYHPLNHTPVANAGTNPYTNPQMQKLRDQLALAVTQEEQKRLSEEMQNVYFDDPPFVHMGQFFQLRVYNKDLMDVDVRGAPVGSPILLNVWWNNERKRAEKP